jgi:nucleoside-diphosphate-sugar epimerase
MKVFVTGGTGVVGTRAIPALVADGHDVTAVARGDEKGALVSSMGAAPVAVDLFDAAAVKATVDGHEVVVHLATNIPTPSKAARKSAWATNERLRIEGSRNLVDAALATGATRYVQESITFPYRDGGDGWLDEDAPLDHDGVFVGAGHAEASAARFAQHGGDGVVLRFAQFHGPGSTHVDAVNAMARRRINAFLGAPDAYWSFIHADDAGAAVAAALRAPGGIYNIADDEPLTRREIGLVLADAIGAKPPRSAPAAARAVMPKMAKALMRSHRISNARFREATGWAPAHPSINGSWAT